MDLSKNYYATLKLTNQATNDEIKKAYRKLAHLHHPDKNLSDNAKQTFQEIQDAYQILTDTQQKQGYDNNSYHGRYYNAFQFNFKKGKSGYEEHLNINTEIEITLSDIYTNKNKTFTYSRNVTCKQCKGTGFEPNDNWSECLFCSGHGTINGKKCKYCKGTGKLYRNQCGICKGNKVLKGVESITISNLYTIDNRKTIRYAEFGLCHRNEPSGTLHGLMRCRAFVQDDGHIFCTEAQIQEEVV
ncbi:MAG: DnaJ domain-containing protein, partial [Candidatus Heimdallarchaeota archaeon]